MARLPLIIVAALALLAAGCCCPALSGRYYEVGLPPPPAVAGTVKKEGATCAPNGSARLAGHHVSWHRRGWFSHRQNDAVPSQQQYDYVNPLPKFHPAPTGPVFETQMHYLPPSDPTAKPPAAPSGH